MEAKSREKEEEKKNPCQSFKNRKQDFKICKIPNRIIYIKITLSLYRQENLKFNEISVCFFILNLVCKALLDCVLRELKVSIQNNFYNVNIHY